MKKMSGNLIGGTLFLLMLIVIMFGESAYLKIKFKNYENNMTSFKAKEGVYYFCMTNSVGGESIKFKVFDENEDLINERSMKLYESEEHCFNIKIPSVNNILTYGKDKWNFFHNMDTEDISEVRWVITRRKSKKNIAGGIYKLKN